MDWKKLLIRWMVGVEKRMGKNWKVFVVGIAFMDGVGNLAVGALSIKERVQWKAWRDVYASSMYCCWMQISTAGIVKILRIWTTSYLCRSRYENGPNPSCFHATCMVVWFSCPTFHAHLNWRFMIDYFCLEMGPVLRDMVYLRFMYGCNGFHGTGAGTTR